MTVSTDSIRALREKTGAGMMDCKKALSENGGDMDKAVTFLRKKGLATAVKKAGRTTSQGIVGSYIHAGGKIGVLVEVNCETDFVARTDEFQAFVRNMAMHVAAANPSYVKREDVPQSVIDAESDVYSVQAKEAKKPEAIVEKIVTGKMESFYKDHCLLEQGFVKTPDQSVKNVLTELVAKLGENMSIRRFTRFQLGENVE